MLGQPTEPPELEQFTGPQRAAALMLALGKEYGSPIWSRLDTEEVRILSGIISRLGSVPAPVIEYLLSKFNRDLVSMTALYGSTETAKQLLRQVLPPDKAEEFIQDLPGPANQSMWDKLSNLSEKVLAGYLRNEYPQTAALIMSRLQPDYAAKVIGALPPDYAIDVLMRMLSMEDVQREVVTEVEQTLRAEFMSTLSPTTRKDPHASIAELFNALDPQTEERLLHALDEKAPDSAERIRALMFTFEDLSNLLPPAVATLVRVADKRELALALKGAEEKLRAFFLSAMTQRAASMLLDDIRAMGPVRARDCHEAQMAIVKLAKSLAESGEIVLVDPKNGEAMIL